MALYYPEVWASHPIPVGGSVWQWFRAMQYRTFLHDVEEGQDPKRLDDVFCLREIINGNCVFEQDFLLSEQYPEIRVTILNNQGVQFEDAGAILPAIIVGDVCVFCPHPEGQLIAVAIASGEGYSKGGELWRKDARSLGTPNTYHTWQLLGSTPDGLILAAFKRYHYSEDFEQTLVWDHEWGEDETYVDGAARVLAESGEHGNTPAGFSLIDPLTGVAVAEHYYEARELEIARYRRGYLYDEITWSPGDDPPVSVALVPRPYGAYITGWAEQPGGGVAYTWSDDGDGHEKWSTLSIRMLADGGITEWHSIASHTDFFFPFAFENGENGGKKLIQSPTLGVYAAASQVVQYRWIGMTDELDPSMAMGGDPDHSLVQCCITPGGLIVFGPQYMGRYGIRQKPGGGNEEVMIRDVKRFVWTAYRRNGANIEQVWEVRLGGQPGSPELDTQRYRHCSTPIYAGGKIYTVVYDYISSQEETERGPVRLVVIEAETGAVLSDTPIDKSIWGGSDEMNTIVNPIAEIHHGRLHFRAIAIVQVPNGIRGELRKVIV